MGAHRILTAEQDAEIARQFVEGTDVPELVLQWGGSRNLIVNSLRLSGVYETRRVLYRYTPEQEAAVVAQFTAGVGIGQLQETFGGSYWSVVHVLERHGVYKQRKRPGRPRRVWTDAEVEEMCAMWDAGDSKSKIAHHFGIQEAKAHEVLEMAGRTVVYRTGAGSGPTHSQWKGGRVKLSKGYIGILVDQDGPIGWAMRRGSGYVPEHRLVMAHSLGRTISDSETIHHINGDRTDNRLENLQLRQGEHGSGVVMQCLDCGSHNVEAVPIAVKKSRKRP